VGTGGARISVMMKWIRAGLLAVTWIVGSAAIDLAAAAPSRANVQNSVVRDEIDFSAGHRVRHHARYVDRAYASPRYYDRPIYYAPAPFVPFNFGYPLLPPPWW
jgi:hypothetical protein